MQMIAVDDEELALQSLLQLLSEICPECSVQGFQNAATALKYLQEHLVDVAFLDVEMYGMNGIEMARRVKETQSQANIIFVTGYSDYAVDAFSVRASGYLLKPVSRNELETELDNLRVPPERLISSRVQVHTFGNFEIFVDHKTLTFRRQKTKELLAYLIDRKGAGATVAEICAVLWEDSKYDVSLQKQFQVLVSDLLRGLKKVDAQQILIRRRNYLAIDPKTVDCDYYRFLEGDIQAINAYTGEYMSNYSWAEFTGGFLYQKSQQ